MFRDFERGLILQEEIERRKAQKQAAAEKRGEKFEWTDEDVFDTIVDMLKSPQFLMDEETENAADMYSDLEEFGDPDENLPQVARSAFVER
jgi:hypothetical protein